MTDVTDAADAADVKDKAPKKKKGWVRRLVGVSVLLAAEAQDTGLFVPHGLDLTSWKLERAPFPLETHLPGVFCAGDVRHNSIKRVSSGVGEGSMAVSFIHQYLALREAVPAVRRS